MLISLNYVHKQLHRSVYSISLLNLVQPLITWTEDAKSIRTISTRMTFLHGTKAVWLKHGGYAAGTSYI
ncbi:hypothetical protein Hanom_Chr06g00553161 [Helianthus anomalus]